MEKGIVFEVNRHSGLFVVESVSGSCAAYLQRSGVRVQVGDVLEGDICGPHTEVLRSTDGGDLQVASGSGPVSFQRAMQIIRRATFQPSSAAPA